MPAKSDYSALVVQAEKAVEAVKDPELKRVAFQKILDDLLSVKGTRTTSATSSTLQPPAAKSKKRHGPKAYVEELINDEFFKKPKTISQAKAELQNRGHHIALTSLSGPLQALCQEKKLRRQKLKTTGKKETFAYSNW